MRLVAAAAIAALTALPSPALPMTWQDVRGICLQSTPACWFYILGVIDAVRNVHRDTICIPENVTQDTAVVVVDAFATRYPEQWPYLQAYDFALAALTAAYPCTTGT